MMLVISVLRYRASVHPLKPAISRRKLKVVCGSVYVVGLIAGYGATVPICFMQWNDVIAIVYFKLHMGSVVSCYFLFPPIFMAVVYYKIGRALIKQKKHIKSVCSNALRRCIQLSLQYRDIYPKSKSFYYLFLHRYLLRSRKYSYDCVLYLANRRRIWFDNEIFYDCLFRWWSENRWFAFSKSSYIWNTGQKIVPILETLPQEIKAGFTGKSNSCCIKLKN